MPSLIDDPEQGVDVPPQTLMAIVQHRGAIGVAWYTVNDAQARPSSLLCTLCCTCPQVHVLQIAEEGRTRDPLPSVRHAVLQAQPDIVHVPSTASPALLATLTGDDDLDAPTIRKQRAGIFSLDHALPMVHNARVHGITDDPSLPLRERILRISACINLASNAQVCAAGALLSIVQRDEQIASARNGVLGALREARLHGHLHLDSATLHGLQVRVHQSSSTANSIDKMYTDICHREPSQCHGNWHCQRRPQRVWFA